MTRAAKTSTPPSTPQKAAASRKAANSRPDKLAGIVLSNPERVLYPEQGITKRQLAEFYVEIADWVLPSIVERPLTLVRCPQGRAKSCFYQKHWTESLPDAVDKVLISEKEGKEEYVVIHDLQGLISLVQLSVLELHPWGARIDRLERPDLLVFDLDPGEDLGWDQVKQAALEVRQALADVDLVSFVRTTGGKGLHVVVPITRRNTWEDVGDFAQSLAESLARRSPEKYTTNMRKNRRGGRIFLDYLRNRRGATAIASYSTRARPGAPVATPLAWEELDELASANQWTIANVPERLQAGGHSPWEQMAALRQSITRRARDAAAALT